MAVSGRLRWVVFLGVLAVWAGLAVLRSGPSPEPLVTVAGPEEVGLSLGELRALPELERDGSYQNRYGNWSTPARFRGVLLQDLVRHLFPELRPREVTVVADDGYRVAFSADRLDDPHYPVVLAYSRDGLSPPVWEEGPQIAVLPEDGRVSNEDYGAESAGAYWVQNVARLELESP